MAIAVCSDLLFWPLTPCRYDESPPYSHLRAGRTHRATEGQRQPPALPGVRGDWWEWGGTYEDWERERERQYLWEKKKTKRIKTTYKNETDKWGRVRLFSGKSGKKRMSRKGKVIIKSKVTLVEAHQPVQSSCYSVRASGSGARNTVDVLLRNSWKQVCSSGRKDSNNSPFCCLSVLCQSFE